MKYLGIDFGRKVIGLALGFHQLAVPYDIITVTDKNTVLQKIKEIVKQEEIQQIVIGFPITQGEEEYLQEVRQFAQDVKEACGIEVFMEDERFSTQEAKRFQQGSDRMDAQAAALILQSFLDKKS